MLSNGSKVVDSFLFSEPFEKEVLLTKLIAEDPVVDEWVAIEDAYTFRGEFKGTSLRQIMDEPRFERFRRKMHIISCQENMFSGHPCEENFFKVEFASRELSRDYILSKYEAQDLVGCSDVDELLDFSDQYRREQLDRILVEAVRNQRIALVKVLKFWYEFDNVSTERKWFPVGPVSVVKDCWRQRQAGEHLYTPYYEPFPLAFEYSYCFSRAEILRKLTTFSHDGYTEADVHNALNGNYWIKATSKGEKLGDRQEDFFERVVLSRDNSTQYVRENFEFLRTGNL